MTQGLSASHTPDEPYFFHHLLYENRNKIVTFSFYCEFLKHSCERSLIDDYCVAEQYLNKIV